MTREDEIAARLAAATPGPWRADHVGGIVGPLARPVTRAHFLSRPASDEARANYRFIAHAPDDIAYLLARVRELEKPVGTICRCGLAKTYHDPRHRPANFEPHEYEPRYPLTFAAWLASPEAQEQMAAAVKAEIADTSDGPLTDKHAHYVAHNLLAALAAAMLEGR